MSELVRRGASAGARFGRIMKNRTKKFRMPTNPISVLLERMKTIYGDSNIQPYGTGPNEKHGTGFRIAEVPATFSVLTLDATLKEGRYDVQIESDPPGDYVYADEVDLDEFMLIVKKICGPESEWP